jgi:hypothetical protein
MAYLFEFCKADYGAAAADGKRDGPPGGSLRRPDLRQFSEKLSSK